MAHEIEQNDGLVLHKKSAWHGLGVIVEEAPTPREALTIAGLDWGVSQRSLFVEDEKGEKIEIPSHVANYRADSGDFLGIVSDNYTVISNAEVADFCSALDEEGGNKVRVETAGSIRNGKKVWFLLKGKPFEVAKGDGMYPYVLVSNGHDGSTPFRVTPTTVRVVCSNTLHAVIPQFDTGDLSSAAFSVRHTVNLMDRIEEARTALQRYGDAIEETRKLADELAKRDVSREEVQKFFLECYTHDFGEVPYNPRDKKEERRRDRAMSAYNSFTRRFDDEREIAGTSLWNAANAYSGLVQHDKKARGKNDLDRVRRRQESNLFGLNQDRTQSALKTAFAMMS